jgi:ribosomal protein S18 acetylase RimI-like enzyme
MSDFNSNNKFIIRTGILGDAESILDIESMVISEGDYLITVTEEYNRSSIQKQREWIQMLLKNEKETLIVAELNSKVVGWIVFYSQSRKRLSHTGSLTMMISKSYRGLGIGKMLVKALIDCEKNPLIEKVSLGVFSTNHRAISLYKNMGFVEEGRKIKEFKLNDNEYIDDILMSKFV